MAGTFSKIYLQIVFTVKKRQPLIDREWKDLLHKYIAGIIINRGQIPIIINSMPDHIHILLIIKPAIAISDLVRDIKNNSTNFINEKKLVKGKFQWQEGYGVFSYGKYQVDSIQQYILKQEEHHRNRLFNDEYLELLKQHDIEFNEKYVFES